MTEIPERVLSASLPNIMRNILIVENSRLFNTTLSNKIKSELNYNTVTATTLKETKELFEKEGLTFHLAILGLVLADSMDTEVIDYVNSYGVPIIICTATYNNDIRKKILSKNVVDYVVKAGVDTFTEITDNINRIFKNQKTKILVVDDSTSSRAYISSLLRKKCFPVHEASDGLEALTFVQNNPSISLVITDYMMPNMDGLTLVKEIRKIYAKTKLAIISLSSKNKGTLSIEFLKNGANDYLNKPFLDEELYNRIILNLDILEYIEQAMSKANRDFLTGCYNRRYFFKEGKGRYDDACTKKQPIAIAVIDIDFFKQVNDTYGHDAGDEALKGLAGLLREYVERDGLVCRLGGEEFCLFLDNVDRESAFAIFETVRKEAEALDIFYEDLIIKITVSIGVATESNKSFEQILNIADKRLYKAKNEGRNRVIID